MHGKESRPQKIKISQEILSDKKRKFFCPFVAVKNYMTLRGGYKNAREQFFVLSDKTPLRAQLVRNTLNDLIKNLGLDNTLYMMHSMRAGRATQLIQLGYPIDVVKCLGRWKSNAIYKYIKT